MRDNTSNVLLEGIFADPKKEKNKKKINNTQSLVLKNR